MKTTLPKIPCGDQLREAWLEAVDLYAIVTRVMGHLDEASKLANDEDRGAKVEAKHAKEAISDLCVAAFKVRDMVTVWQAWASENSDIDKV